MRKIINNNDTAKRHSKSVHEQSSNCNVHMQHERPDEPMKACPTIKIDLRTKTQDKITSTILLTYESFPSNEDGNGWIWERELLSNPKP
jgi:hypothetical protein